MRRIFIGILTNVLFCIVLFPAFSFADEATSTPDQATSTPPIATSTPPYVPTIIEGSVDVPFNCTLTDTDNVSHTYPEATSTTSHLAICAIHAALEGGVIASAGLSNQFPAFGLMLVSVSGVEADPSSQYWALLHNGGFASNGLTSLAIAQGDTLVLELRDFSDTPTGDKLTLHIGSLVPAPLSIEGSVDVPFTCSATDTDNVVHTYPESTTTASYLGICAIAAALESGLVDDVGLSNQFPAFGLMLVSVSGVEADPSSQFWGIVHNGGFANSGLTSLSLAADDTLTFELQDFSSNLTGDTLTIHINSLIATSTPQPPQNPGGGGGVNHPAFNLSSALSYLSSKQNPNGSFESGTDAFFSDWTAIAFGAVDPGAAKQKLREYLLTARPNLSSATDYERHAMGLMSLGIDPYSGTGVDYVSPIVGMFDGTQIGSPSLSNDDIFSLFVLLKAGYSPNDPMIQKIGTFILSMQNPDGSWDKGGPNADITAAAIQALGPLFTTPLARDLGPAIGKASAYLSATQQQDGGWLNADSTSWVQIMVNSARENDPTRAPTFTTASGAIPMDYIARAQQNDGSVQSLSGDSTTRVWSTGYAIIAASGKSWLSIVQSFPKPQNAGGGGSGGSVLGVSTSTVATSTTPTATTTPLIATSTPTTATSSPQTATTTLTILEATTTATTTPAKKPTPKKTTVKEAPAPKTTATAPAAVPSEMPAEKEVTSPPKSNGGFFGTIKKFFSWLSSLI